MGFFETSFMPGREFESPGDYNAQLAAWLPRANSRMLRRTGEQPGVRVAADVAAMRAMPPVAPSVGTRERVRLGRDYYVRIAGNDYSVDPERDRPVRRRPRGPHERENHVHWRGCESSSTMLVEPPDHHRPGPRRDRGRTADRVQTTRHRHARPRSRPATTGVGLRALSDYDTMFNLTPASATTTGLAPDLQVVW